MKILFKYKFLFLCTLIFSCSQQNINERQQLMQDSTMYSMMVDSAMSLDSARMTEDFVENKTQQEIVFSKEDSIKFEKMKIRNQTIYMLEDTVSSIGSKLDSISEYLKK